MNKKLILTSLAAGALFAACTSEELVPQTTVGTDVFSTRPKIDLSFALETPETRMTVSEDGANVVFEKTDNLGAVLVDKGSASEANYWDLITSNTHIGNNKFFYDEAKEKFVTDGTMSVGSWLFYAKYDKANTGNRGSIKYELPAVLDYASNFKSIAEKDFKFSPVVELGGSEDGHFEGLNIKAVSAWTYARIVLEFENAVTVQKLVLKPYSEGTDYTKAPFAKTYELNMGENKNDPSTNVSGLWEAVADWHTDAVSPDSWQKRMDEAASKLLSKDNFIEATVGVKGTPEVSNEQDLIALNCLDAKLTAAKKFEGYMMIPPGHYVGIRLYAYTDKGVYVYDLDDEYEAIPETEKSNTPYNQEGFTLARQHVDLHNIAKLSSQNPAPEGYEYDSKFAAVESKSLKMNEKVSNADLKTDAHTEGTVVISQEDLIAVINGVAEEGDVKIRVLGDKVKINKAVADAIAAKEIALGSGKDIQLVFTDKVDVIGEETAYDLKDVTFEKGAELVSGKVNISDDVNITRGGVSIFTVKAGAELSVDVVANTVKSYAYNNISNHGKTTMNAENVLVPNLSNYGTLEFTKNARLTYYNNYAGSVTTVGENAVLSAPVKNNNSADGMTGAVLTNNGVIELTGNSLNSSKSTINNNGEMKTQAYEFDNEGVMNNAADAIITCGNAGTNGGLLYNEKTGTVNNSGMIWCNNGDNVIVNIGVINAKANSTTYITRNSSYDEGDLTMNELTEGTAACNMGVINVDNRGEDVSVTTEEFKGYIVFTTDLSKIEMEDDDKFNKIVLTSNAVVEHEFVRYIETSASRVDIGDASIQEIIFNSGCTLVAKEAKIASITIAEKKTVKVPTNNSIYVQTVTSVGSSKTIGAIDNKGTLLVGGDLYSDASEGGFDECPSKGTFASGDGNSTAFHWNYIQ